MRHVNIATKNMALAPDTPINEYRILNLLGKGGMGEVYLAVDTKLDRRVAIKVLSAEYVADPVRRKWFDREAKAASRLSHANSAHVYAFGEWQGGAYLVLEYVEGRTLKTVLTEGRMKWDEVAHIGAQLADVLQAAHDCGIIHRDVKSQNVMLTASRSVKLLDFGLARLQQPNAIAEDGVTESAVSHPGAILGTVGYMSPEQALGKELDHRTDLFSLGVVLYEMAAGNRPFSGASSVEVLSKILTAAPEPLGTWNPETPPEMERIIVKCLQKSPDERYQSAREIAIDLRAWLRGGSSGAPVSAPLPAASAPPPPPPPLQPAATNRRTLLVAASGGAALAALGGYAAYRAWWPPEPGSIAVLPFSSEGSDEAGLLTDGLTEGLIDRIAASSMLRVIARSAVFRFKKIDDPLGVVRKLKADTMLAGRLTANADNVEVTAELADVGSSQRIWSQKLQARRSEIQSLPERLADLVLKALGIRKRSRPEAATRSVDPEAYRNFLKARQALTRRVPDAFGIALECFRKAIEIEPQYAAAYAGMADVYTLLSGQRPPNEVCPKAKAAARKAIELDGSLADGHAAQGFVQLHYDYAWKDSEEAFQRALAANPSYAPAHSYYARLLTARQRFAEAKTEQERAIQLDPLSPTLAGALAVTYYHWRRYPEAETVLTSVLADSPKSVQTLAMLGVVRHARGNHAGAIEAGEKCHELIGGEDPGILADLAAAYAGAGNREQAADKVSRIERMAEKEYVAPYYLAVALLSLQEKDRALALLEKAVEVDHSWHVFSFGVDPKLDPLRAEPRFIKLLSRLGLVTG